METETGGSGRGGQGEGNGEMIIDFEDVRHLIPNYIFNEYGQLTGNYVYCDQIVCVSENCRIQVWLNQEAFERRDAEGLICDYDEADLSYGSGSPHHTAG